VRTHKIVLFFLPLVFILSCKPLRKILTSETTYYNAAGLKHENASFLLSKLKKRKFDYKWISAHFSVDIDVDSSHTSFSGTVRIRKDSIIWMTISPLLGIEVARVLLNKDTAMFIDKIHDRYFKGNYDYIDSLLDDDIDYELIQSVMVGSNIDFYSDTSKLNGYYDGQQYLLSTVARRQIRKILFRNGSIRTKNDVQFIWFDKKDYHINRIRVEDFVNHRTLDAFYGDFQQVDSVMFPTHIQYLITAEKTIKIDLQYKKVYFKTQEETPFTILPKYERIQYQK
jgi:outer membrane lipoprotein-sorting protein